MTRSTGKAKWGPFYYTLSWHPCTLRNVETQFVPGTAQNSNSLCLHHSIHTLAEAGEKKKFLPTQHPLFHVRTGQKTRERNVSWWVEYLKLELQPPCEVKHGLALGQQVLTTIVSKWTPECSVEWKEEGEGWDSVFFSFWFVCSVCVWGGVCTCTCVCVSLSLTLKITET